MSGRPPGYDRVRNAEIGNKDFELDVLEEAYTSEHWIVRIYKVGKFVMTKKENPIVKLSLSISIYFNLFLSLRDRERADTKITLPHHHPPPTENFCQLVYQT